MQQQPTTNKELAQVMCNPKWRIANLYSVIDQYGKEMSFRLRDVQRDFLENIWWYNIILKARQEGFTTLIDIMGLDYVLFHTNAKAMIIAETKAKAAEIFDSKVSYAYDKLPKEIRNQVKLVTRTKDGEMSFSNGSKINVTVSARSGTCQFLHVSEFGPICAQSPAKAKEIVTGSFPAVHAGGYIFVESTAMGSEGYFYLMVMNALADKLRKKKLGIQEFKLHFYPWWSLPEYQTAGGGVIPDRLLRYFDDLYERHGISCTEAQQLWYANMEKTLGNEMWREYPSYAEEAFRVAQDGSYYGGQFIKLYRRNGVCAVPYLEEYPVYTAWDLGVSDQTCIWFIQAVGMEIRVIDYYENSGEGLAHYAKIVNERGYRYARHFGPHDIAHRELGTGVSRIDTARGFGLDFEAIPTNADLPGGIDAVRKILDYCWFDEAKTEQGRKALEAYKREWDDKHGCWKSHPLHDWSSHASDAFRTFAVAWGSGRVSSNGGGQGYWSGGGYGLEATGGLS